MKTIGLLGGMSWESTVTYYQVVNRIVARELGGLNSARVVLYSLNFQDIADLPSQDRWDDVGAILAEGARGLKAAGADFVVLCVNTMHKVAEQVEREGGLPLLHILDATADRIQQAGFRTVGLLGTRFVMEGDFFRGRLERDFGLSVLIPAEHDREFVHSIIFSELTRGIFDPASRARCREIIAALVANGAEGVVLACTELPLLLSSDDSAVPLFDTTTIHAEEAARTALR